MNHQNKKSNALINQSSPYLLQHAYNPVDWYPWGEEAFSKAKAEDKPIFLSIGYSTCHWCHVMAHESFEDQEIADILNKYFVSIKVDREERPDLDSIYMSVCQAFTGSGGWPMSVIITAEQKPFFAGTYFPKNSRHGMIGFKELLLQIHEKWVTDRDTLLQSAHEITSVLQKSSSGPSEFSRSEDQLIEEAISQYKQSYDFANGGFGYAPKFPTPHNLIFLLQQYEKDGDKTLLAMVEKTLQAMYKGGIFDHIGYGFSRYSTDDRFLVPHFEKMLYDNALLIMVYSYAYSITKNTFYKTVAEKTARFIQSEMTSEQGGFYSAQDADSDGIEGKYYVFEPDEIIHLLGKEIGTSINTYYNITKEGNFEGKSIPNLLLSFKSGSECQEPNNLRDVLPMIRDYRQKRCKLHLDDKILTSWNSLMIAAFCWLYRITSNPDYLNTAKKAQRFIESKLCENNTLYVSCRNGRGLQKGFLDDYASYIYALIQIYNATLDSQYLLRAEELMHKTIADFFDSENGGFYLSGAENEALLIRPKECYDGAIPSGNSMVTRCLVSLNALLPDNAFHTQLEKQIAYLSSEASSYPAGYSMFLQALSDETDPPMTITTVLKDESEIHTEQLSQLPFKAPLFATIKVLHHETQEYKLTQGKTTYYVCQNHTCKPPVNELDSSIPATCANLECE